LNFWTYSTAVMLITVALSVQPVDVVFAVQMSPFLSHRSEANRLASVLS